MIINHGLSFQEQALEELTQSLLSHSLYFSNTEEAEAERKSLLKASKASEFIAVVKFDRQFNKRET